MKYKVDRSKSSLILSSPLLEAVIIERPNRYVAEVATISDGVVYRAYVPVSGRIGGLTLDGLPCLLSGPHVNRSTEYTVEAIGSCYSQDDIDFQWIGINQTASNSYVESFLKAGLLSKLAGDLDVRTLKREQKLGAKRIDLTLGIAEPADLWIEVKTPLISLATEIDSDVPIKTDYSSAPPSSRMPEQFEELAKLRRLGRRVVLLGVFGYNGWGYSNYADRFKANLNLDGLVDSGLELGFEFAQIELEYTPERIKLTRYTKLFK